MGRLQEKKKQKMEALLDAAFELFVTQGIHETSVSDIVHRANMAKGTFYLYFKDKYQVRDALIHRKAKNLVRLAASELQDTQTRSVEEKLIFMADYILDFFENNKEILRFISKNLSWGLFRSVLMEFPVEDGEGNLYQMFLNVLKDSGRKFRQPELMIYMVIELINGTCYNVILHGEPVSLPELKPDLFQGIRRIVDIYDVTGTQDASVAVSAGSAEEERTICEQENLYDALDEAGV